MLVTLINQQLISIGLNLLILMGCILGITICTGMIISIAKDIIRDIRAIRDIERKE